MKKVFVFMIYLVTFAMFYSCGEQGQSIAKIAAEKAIGTYIEQYIGEIELEEVKTKIMEKRELLPSMALEKFLLDESIQALDFTQRVEQAVVLALSEATGLDPSEFNF